MANYNVYMGQGISVNDVRGTILITGPGSSGDKVQSCSAIIMVNRIDWRAGIYHFPEGSINRDGHSQAALFKMANAVQPTQGYIAFGVVGLSDKDANCKQKHLDNETLKQVQHGEQLRSFVLGLLPIGGRLSRCPAKGGVVSVTSTFGEVVLSNNDPGNLVDLKKVKAGSYTGYTIYGHALC